MIQVEDLAEVLITYNWRGNQTGYRAGNSFVPMDAGNSDFRRIQAAIAEGKCSAKEPEITQAVRAFGARGEVTGFDTDLGFVPNEPANKLFRILESSILDGKCVIADPGSRALDPTEYVETIIVCVFFGRSWPHLAGTFERTFPYRSSTQSAPVDLLVRLRNVPSQEPGTAIDALLNEYGISFGVPFAALPLQAGVLEIEIPVNRLQKLFRSEKSMLDEEWAPFLGELVAEHLVRAGRSGRQGPDREWLIGNAGRYLGRLLVSLGNVVIRTFALEWGGSSPGHLKSETLYRQRVILARLANGRLRLLYAGLGASQSFQLEGAWPDYGSAIQEILNPTENPLGHRRHVPSRVRQMLNAGFTMEAVALLSAFLEIFIRDGLIAAVQPTTAAIKAVKEIGHGARLDMLRELNIASVAPPFDHAAFAETIQLAAEVYRRRNDYLHDLALPNEGAWLSVDGEKDISRLISAFADSPNQMRRFGLLTALWRANDATKQFLTSTALARASGARPRSSSPATPTASTTA